MTRTIPSVGSSVMRPVGDAKGDDITFTHVGHFGDMMPGHIVQGCSAEMGADVEQTADHGQDAGEHADVGTWIALKDAAALLGISVDTVKRRMHRGELESRRETIPQGFRWLVRIDPPETEAGESSLSDRSDDRGVHVPLPSTDVVAVVQAQLEARNREVASLLATVASKHAH